MPQAQAQEVAPPAALTGYEEQKAVAGAAVNVNGTIWILLYKIPVVDQTDKKMAYYLAVEKDAALPAPTKLLGVPIL